MEKIMVVDDMRVGVMMMRETLEDAGYKDVVSFNNPTEAIQALESLDGLRLIITDYHMPDMNGVELLKIAQKFDGRIKGVILTSDITVKSDTASGYTVVYKGIDFERPLLKYVASVLQ